MAPSDLLSARRLAAAGAIAATALAVAACGSTDNGSPASSSSSSGAAAGGPTVTAQNFSFSPATVPVSAGSVTVTFKNADSASHSLTLDNGGGEVVASGGQTVTLTFSAPQSGTVAFHCKFHSSMHGSFTVGGSGGAGAGGASTGSSSSSSSNGYGY